MALVDVRQRAGYLFVAVVVAHIILISAQVNSRSGVPVLESVTFGLFAEVQRAATAVVSGFRGMWSGYVSLQEVQTENAALKKQLAEVQLQLQEQRALADRSRGLEQLLGLRDRSRLDTAAADVIAAGASPEFRTLTIDKGTQHGLRTDMAVIAPTGIVGRIVVPSRRAAKVQLLIDRGAAAGAIVERSRAQGVAVGIGDDRLRMEFKYVSEVADVKVGDVLVTSGIDGIYPKGFVIGTVETIVKSESGGAYKEITVKPAVDFYNLEEVLVVLTKSPAGEAAEVEERSQ
jgi:rod shape-determining protein MreC